MRATAGRILSTLGVLGAGACFSPGVGAQLISPGELSEAHGELKGMGNCTQCHQFRAPGADPSRCLQCHQALGQRIDEGRGYHGRLGEEDCGVCHKEHLGADFHLVRMDPDTFPHASTGYSLEKAHLQALCRDCHSPERVQDPAVLEELTTDGGLERTYLGLPLECAGCHEADDPHRGQFPGEDCGACHAQEEWRGASEFDHRLTSYPLEGRHQDAPCEGCHVADQVDQEDAVIRYKPVAVFDCASCHEDPHEGRMTGRCGTCHTTAEWDRVKRRAVERGFDHSGTGFALMGAHESTDCQACHTPGRTSAPGILLTFPDGGAATSYPAPARESCLSCHLDAHEGVFQDPSCDLCHTQDSWIPPDYDRSRHRMELRFDLSGAHAVTPCSSCHEKGAGVSRELVFRFEDPGSCTVCHETDDPHEGAFEADGCDLCHVDESFFMNRFDHELLSEAGWRGSCAVCHQTDDRHGSQFVGRDCGACHGTDSFLLPDFDHSATRFPLDGAQVQCSGCHIRESGPGEGPMIRYRPLETECVACHGGGA